jgi:hypothetical protein
MDALVQCCRMDMRLISLDDFSKLKCLAEFVNCKGIKIVFSTISLYLKCKLLANSGSFARTNYLVAASDRVKDGAYEWCTSDVPTNVSSFVKWKPGQPDNYKNAEHCGFITASSGTVPDNILLSDLSCESDKGKYLCEV